MYFVYVLQSERNGRYYIGSSEDVARRLLEHNAGMTQATRFLRPWRVIYTEPAETLAEARRREAQIKRWKSRKYMREQLALPE